MRMTIGSRANAASSQVGSLYQDVRPQAGTLVLFKSDTVSHEVCLPQLHSRNRHSPRNASPRNKVVVKCTCSQYE